jgi:hypothetical protein
VSAPTNLSPATWTTQALGLDGYGSLVDYLLEQIPELMHPYSVRTFAKMRHEPQLAAILQGVHARDHDAGKWTVNGRLPRRGDAADRRRPRPADQGGRPDPDRRAPPRFTWAKHLPTVASLRLTFGHAPFAQQWNLEEGPTAGGSRMVQERMPQTISICT